MSIRFLSTVTTALVAGLFLIAGGCANEVPEEAPTTDDNGVTVDGTALGATLASCSTAGSSGYDSGTETLSLALGGGVTEIVVAVRTDVVSVNFNPCVDSAGEELTTSDVTKIEITGTTGDDVVILDLSEGSFGSIFSTQGGVSIDMAGGTGDAFKVYGTNSGTDDFTMGTDGTDHFFELSGDKNADVRVENAESFTVALGDGDDEFSGAGGAISAAHLVTGVSSLSAASADITVYGGEDDDELQGGDGDDTISGGEGDDTFIAAAAADGADTYNGGGGEDTMDYSARTGDLTVTLDGTGNDGLSGETDDVKTDVENVIGGDGDDTITGSDVSNVLEGGPGDDTLNGGTGNADCTLDVDVLEGGDGDDTFTQGSAADCGDEMVGGDGTDVATYTSRTNDLTIDIDSKADDGEASEADNVKTDIEKVIGGAGNDTITGSTGDDVIDGGAGDDVLSGNSGNDTFLCAATDDGGDAINGGDGVDTIDYSARTAALTITLCIDEDADTGNSSAGDCATANDGLSGEEDNVINCEGIIAGSGDDTITGADSDDTLEGKDGDDTISGGAGDDNIFGDADDDTLDGGADDDYVDGGAGTNTADGGAGDGDICSQATATNCEL